MTAIRCIDPQNDPAWDAKLAAFPQATLFHTAAWARILRQTYRYDPTYLVVGDPEKPQAVFPLMDVRSWLTGHRGVSLPFTDECAPLCHSPEEVSLLLEAAISLGRSLRWKTLELRTALFPSLSSRSPSLPLSPSLLPPVSPYQPSTSYWSHRLALTSDTASLFSRFDSATRRAVRKGEAGQLQIEVATSLTAIRSFYDLMCQTRRRHGVPPQPWSFFENLQKIILALGKGCIVLAKRSEPATCTRAVPAQQKDDDPPSIPWAGGTQPPPTPIIESSVPVAGAVFLYSGRTVHYKFGASDEAQQQLRANNLVMWHGIKWHAQRGFTSLDFGRTSLHNEGLRRFKLSWGTEERRLGYTKIDLSSGRYLTAPDRASGWQTPVFQKLPIPLSRLIGRILYRHMG